MTTTVQRWGNSQGLRLSRQILDAAGICVGDRVEITLEAGAIVIAPVRPARGRQSLQELVSRIPKDYQAEEVDWGRPVGREEW